MDRDVRRQKLEALIDSVAAGMRANQEGRPREGREILREAWNEAKCWDCTSGLIAWQLAVSHDLMGDSNFALKFIAEALRIDPFPAPFRASCEIIVANARPKLAKLEVTNTGIRGIVDGLSKVGAAKVDDHLLLARHCSERGLQDEALAAAEEALKLDPECQAAQFARAAISSGMRWSLGPREEEAGLALAQALGGGKLGEA